jgi:hypothetical protein
MQVFISWSQPRSLLLATALKRFMQRVIQSLQPWLSADDIEKGSRWFDEIGKTLDVCDVGIICITPENVNSTWLHFEAGALAKKLGKSRVVPYLLGFDVSALRPPLSMFDAAWFDKVQTRRVFKMLNNSLDDTRITESLLDETFEIWWPKFEEEVGKIPPSEVEPPKPPDTNEMLASMNAQLQRVLEQLDGRSMPRVSYSPINYFPEFFSPEKALIKLSVNEIVSRLEAMREAFKKYASNKPDVSNPAATSDYLDHATALAEEGKRFRNELVRRGEEQLIRERNLNFSVNFVRGND